MEPPRCDDCGDVAETLHLLPSSTAPASVALACERHDPGGDVFLVDEPSDAVLDSVARIRPGVAKALAAAQARAADGEVFISYARREFYFVLSLTRQLQAEGLQVWLDAARLAPGVDWLAELLGAVDRSSGVVLVASRAAMASEHVQAEWRRAQSAGKPVHVVFAEAVELPEDLRPASVHDLRIRFTRRAPRLAAALRAAPRPAITHPRGVRLPFAVWWLAFVLFAIAAFGFARGYLLVWANLIVEPRATSPPMTVKLTLWAAQTLIPLWALRSLLRRDFIPLVVVPLAPLAVIASMVLRDWEFLDVHFSERQTLPAEWLTAVFYPRGPSAALLLLALSATAIAFVSPSFHRWLPTGARLAVGSVKLGATLPTETSLVGWLRWLRYIYGDTFDDNRLENWLGWIGRVPPPGSRAADEPPRRVVRVLHDSPEDAGIAASLSGELRRSHHTITTDEGSDAYCEIVIVSTDTRRAWLGRRVAEAPPNVIFLFATGIRAPETIPGLTRHQWVDYRRRKPATLGLLATMLSSSGPTSLGAGLSLEPERIDKPVTPWGVFSLSSAYVFLAGPAIGAGVMTLLVEAPRRDGDMCCWAPFFVSGVGPLVLAIGVVLAMSALRLLRRRLTRWELVAGFGLSMAAQLLIGGTPTISFVDPVEAGGEIRWASIVVLGVAFYVCVFAGEVWQWAPRTRSIGSRHRRDCLPAPPLSRAWLAYLLLSAVFWGAIVHSWQNPEF